MCFLPLRGLLYVELSILNHEYYTHYSFQADVHVFGYWSPSNKGIKVAKSMVNNLNPVFEQEFGYTFQKAMIEAHNLSPQESSKDKDKKVQKSVRQTKQSITKSIEENDKDATILLSMGKSYSQYERERLGLCYQSKTDAEKSMLKRNEQELDGKVKPKKHHGKYTNVNSVLFSLIFLFCVICPYHLHSYVYLIY
jgi:hypothetical protein